MPRFTLCLFLLFFVVKCAIAQKGYFELGFILQNNDTISGFIERNPEEDLGLSIKYKAQQDSEIIHEYLPLDITGFGFSADKIWFEAVEVELKEEGGFIKNNRFAKILLKGHTDLFKLQLRSNEYNTILRKDITHVYIIRKGSEYYTLGQYEYMVGNAVGVNKRFIGTLTLLLHESQDILQKIDDLKFNDQSIIKLIEDYNTRVSPTTRTYSYTHKVKPIIIHGIESAYASFISSEIDTWTGYSMGYFLDTFNPGFSKRVSVRLGVSYFYSKVVREFYPEEPTASIHAVRFPMALQLNLSSSPKAPFLPFINIGMSQYVYPEKFHMHSTVALGAGMYARKVMVACSLENLGFLKSASPTMVNFSVGFRLDREKD